MITNSSDAIKANKAIRLLLEVQRKNGGWPPRCSQYQILKVLPQCTLSHTFPKDGEEMPDKI
jgi:hypothetical protein